MSDCIIIYYSVHHSNTRKIAERMAETSGADIMDAADLKNFDAEKYSLVGLGSGIAYGRHYKKFMESVSRLNLSGKKVFVFSTSGTGKKDYNNALIEQLHNMGAVNAGSFACRGFDTYGPFKVIGGISKNHPDDADLSNASDFIKNVMAQK